MDPYSNPRQTDPSPTQRVRVNPYRLFGINQDSDFTRGDIRQTMRTLVLSTHPDRPGGSERKFRVVMECYKYLLGVVAERERTTVPVNDTTIQQHETAREEENISLDIPRVNADRFGGSKKFDKEGFNKFFEENRLDDTLARGHGDWLKDDSSDYESHHREKLGKGQFQEAFEAERRRLLAKRQIVKHTGLVGMSIGKPRLASTDVDELGQMSSSSAGTVRCSNGVMGVDLREALEVGVLGVDDATRDRYTTEGTVSVEEARRRREGARITFTDEEKMEYEQYQKEQERKEAARKRRLRERESQIRDHFQRVNRMLTN